jgi:hypothetical protein
METKCLPMPWKGEEAFGRKPVFGWFVGNELFEHVAPSVERAVRDTVARLRARGYTVKGWLSLVLGYVSSFNVF